MSCDVGEATEGLENELCRRLCDVRVWRMSCDVGEVMERLENELFFHSFSFVIRKNYASTFVYKAIPTT